MHVISLDTLGSPDLPTIASTPAQAQLDLRDAARGGLALVVVTTDLQADRALDDPHAAFIETFDDPDDHARTRVIGPASGGVHTGPGGALLVTAIGPLAARIAQAIGPELALAIDLGHAWDLGAAELVSALADDPRIETLHTLGLALPPAAWPALAPALRRLQGRLALFAHAPSADGALARALAAHGVACLDDLGALARALATPPADRPRGPRVAVVTSTTPLGALVAPALTAAGLTLAAPSQATIDQLASELPERTRFTPFIRIPDPTRRHAELARESLAADLRVDHVLAFDLPGHPARDPSIEARHLAALAAATAALAHPPSPLPAALTEPPSPRAEALVAAALLMRKRTLDRDATLALLTAFDPSLTRAPAIAIANLAGASSAARQLGYPVRLGDDPTPIADERALESRWQSIVAALSTTDPHLALSVTPAPADVTTLRYRAQLLPIVTITSPAHELALPARVTDLEPLGALTPLVIALSRVAMTLPAVRSLELTAASGADHPVVLIHASATLTAPESD